MSLKLKEGEIFPERMIFKDDKDFKIYQDKVELVMQTQKKGDIDPTAFVKIINETFTPEEILCMACFHYMHIFVKEITK